MPNRRSDRLPGHLNALVLLLLLSAGLAHALPDDRDQPIHISADKALRDEKKGFTVYSGNVQMSQGSMELEADILTIYHVSDEADKIVAEGKPAKMRQQPELDKGVIHAHADVIEYFRSEERVHLQSNARIEQDGALVTGDVIDYFILEQLFEAESDPDKRVEVIIPPSVPQETTNTPPAEQPAVAAPAESDQPPAATPPGGTAPKVATPAAGKQQEEDGSGATESE